MTTQNQGPGRQPLRYWAGGKRAPAQDRFFIEALEAAGWEAGDQKNWQACWYTGMPATGIMRRAGPECVINHIPGNGALTVKSRLFKTVAALREQMTAAYGRDHPLTQRVNFLPHVYSMPEDYHTLQQLAHEHPEKRWILKPKNSSRGRGVRVVTDIADIPMDSSWMVQEYMQRTHTMRQRKYVLRLYVLIASIDPLRVYLYRQGFAKLASEPYDINDADNPFSQLTNPDINALNKSVDTPVEFVDFDRYRAWLRDEGHDDEALFERVRDLVKLTGIAAAEPMRQRAKETGVDQRGCYELLGIDCLIDEDLKPWILECNLSPSLDICADESTGGTVEERVKGGMVADALHLVGLTDDEPSAQLDNPVQDIQQQCAAELARAGGFERLVPHTDTEDYLPFFGVPRLSDWVAAEAVAEQPLKSLQLCPRKASEIITDDRLSLYEPGTGRLHSLNDTAALIWLAAMEGWAPDRIAEHLAEAVTSEADNKGELPDAWTLRRTVWDTLAEWNHMGLLMPHAKDSLATDVADDALPVPERSPDIRTGSALELTLRLGAQTVLLRTDSMPVARCIDSPLSALVMSGAGEHDIDRRLEISRDHPGYSLILDGEVMASRVKLSQVGTAVHRLLARMVPQAGQILLDATLLLNNLEPTALMVLSSEASNTDDTALELAHRLDFAATRGVVTDRSDINALQPLEMPTVSAQGQLILSSLAGVPNTVSITTVLLPDKTLSTEDPALIPASISDLLPAAIPLAFGHNGAPLDEDALRTLISWLDERVLYRMNPSRPQAATSALNEGALTTGRVVKEPISE